MKRYAFIDVHNTKSTAGILGFLLDPEKLYNYLVHDKWSCTKVFWYSGRIVKEKQEKEREKIEQIGYEIRDKVTMFHNRHAKKYDVQCPKCKWEFEHVVRRQGLPKANCDVELTIDCLELAGPESEFLIFTGDGDFKYLIEKLLQKQSKVALFSTRKPDMFGDYRFSTRYDDLLKAGTITFIELNNLKFRLKKEEVDEAKSV